MILREYQQEIVSRVLLTDNKHNIVVCGCGSGKSVMSATVAKHFTTMGRRVLFLVHRRELLNQIVNTYRNVGVNLDLCDFEMVQTYCRHLQEPSYYRLIIVDECHLNYKAYKSIIDHHSHALVVGWTATPVRLSNGGLGDIYTNLIEGVSTEWLIEQGYLAPYKYYSVKLADTSKVHVTRGDYDKNEVAVLMQKTEVYGATVEQWRKLANGKKTIVYCSTLQSSKSTCEAFHSAGVSCAHLDGNTPTLVRNHVMDLFRKGDITVLCNVDLFDVGLDVPDCECVVILRPTKSLAKHIQMTMRCMRYQPDKTAIIIDHVGNCYSHGLPDDKREWSLETSKKKEEAIVKIKECPNCFAVYSPVLPTCPYCGVATTVARVTQGKKTVEVDLVEVERVRKLAETPLNQFHAETFDQVKEYQKLRGYKFGWCLRYCVQHNIEVPSKYDYMMWRFMR